MRDRPVTGKGLQYSKDALVHNELLKLLRQDVINENAIRSLLMIDKSDLKKITTRMIDKLRLSVRPDGDRDWETNALPIGTIDAGFSLDAVLKFSNENDIVSVLAEMDMKTLVWLQQYIIADASAEKILHIAIKRKENIGLHELREAWMSKRSTDPLPCKNENDTSPQKTPSDPGVKKL